MLLEDGFPMCPDSVHSLANTVETFVWTHTLTPETLVHNIGSRTTETLLRHSVEQVRHF